MSRKIDDVEKYGVKELPCSLGEHMAPVSSFGKLKTGSYNSACRPCLAKYKRENYRLKPRQKRYNDIRKAINQCRRKIYYLQIKRSNLENMLSRELQREDMGKGILPKTSVSKNRQTYFQNKALLKKEAGSKQDAVLPGSQKVQGGTSQLCNHLPSMHGQDAGGTPPERQGEIPDGQVNLVACM